MNDRESTRKYSTSGTFVDLCDRCFATVADDIPDTEGEIEDGWDDEEKDGGWDYQQYMGDDCSDC